MITPLLSLPRQVAVDEICRPRDSQRDMLLVRMAKKSNSTKQLPLLENSASARCCFCRSCVCLSMMMMPNSLCWLPELKQSGALRLLILHSWSLPPTRSGPIRLMDWICACRCCRCSDVSDTHTMNRCFHPDKRNGLE